MHSPEINAEDITGKTISAMVMVTQDEQIYLRKFCT